MIFAVDCGGTTIKTCLVDSQGKLHAKEAFPLKREAGIEGFRSALSDIFHQRFNECAENKTHMEAIGFGSRGVIDAANAVLLEDTGDLSFFNGHSFRELLETNLPIGAENDATAATMGEMIYGIGRDMKNFIMLTLGTGIGGGIVVDGAIYKGHTGMAGELGHFPVNPEGRKCPCGNIGCVEREFSAEAFEQAMAPLNENRKANEKIEDVKALFDAAQRGDKQAEDAIDRGVHFLATAISGYANAFDPEKVILAGGISKAGEYLRKKIVDALDPILWRKEADAFVEISRLGADMGLYGAGAVGAAQLRPVQKIGD